MTDTMERVDDLILWEEHTHDPTCQGIQRHKCTSIAVASAKRSCDGKASLWCDGLLQHFQAWKDVYLCRKCHQHIGDCYRISAL